MKKGWLIVVLISIMVTGVLAKKNRIELKFDNIVIKSIHFTDEADIRISSWDDALVDMNIRYNKCYISSKVEETEIKLFLPIQNRYYYRLRNSNENENMKCFFDFEKLILMNNKEVIIRFDNERFEIFDNDNSQISISEKGISIMDDDDIISIKSDGIFLGNEDESEYLSGFWGKLLGSIITSTVSTIADDIGRERGIQELAKQIINDDFGDKIIIHNGD